MSSDVVLTSALRTNLLSLQNTQNLIDDTQLKLATGLKVNSALDNPQSFFAAQSLDNRASDLSRLLDGIGQSVRTIEEADNGIKSLTKLVEQAESVATSALEATSSASESTSIQGNVDLEDFKVASTYNGDTITFTAANDQSQSIALTGGAITLATDDTEQDIINSINAITDSEGNQVLKASLSDSGRLQVETLSDINFQVEIDGGPAATSQSLASELGLGGIGRLKTPNVANSTVVVTSKAAATVSSASLFSDAAGDTIAKRSDTLDSLRRDGATTAGFQDTDILTLTDSTSTGAGTSETFNIEIGVNGVARQEIAITDTTTVQGLIDDINSNSVLKTQVRASFNDTTGQINLTSLSSDVESIEFTVSVSDSDTDNEAQIAANFGFGVQGALSATAPATSNTQGEADVESIRISGGGGEVAQFEDDYNTIREQIDSLVKDASYRGTNLLNGDDLVTTFNEDRTNTLTTEGGDFTVSGLGIDGAAFLNKGNIEEALTQTRNALTKVRNFGQSISNDLAIIQTRRDFTEATINTLEAGADDLTVADQNEEGANLLALQTRQTLGVTALSLASQSQQAVLRLF